MRKQAHLTILGIVQGVFYRDFTQENALELGLTGWVRNVSDGTVETCVQGTEEEIKELIQRCYEGPPSAQVEDIKVEWENLDEKFDTFEVRFSN
ncbi:acylphosphatase [Patescibacteria group bacterium]